MSSTHLTSEPDASLIAKCRQCIALKQTDHLVFRAAADPGSVEQGINEKLSDPIGERALELCREIGAMRPVTLEGRKAYAQVAMHFAGREQDDTISIDYVGEELAWRLVADIAEGRA